MAGDLGNYVGRGPEQMRGVERPVAYGCLNHGSLHACLQIAEQPVKGCSISGMLMPYTEEISAFFAPRVTMKSD